MDLHDVRDLFTYSDHCRAALREVLASHLDVLDRELGTISQYNTVRRLLAHTIGAEERWIVMRIGGRAVQSYEERAAEAMDGLFADWERVRSNTRAYMDGLAAPDLEQVIHVTLGGATAGWSWEGDLTIKQILIHIIVHETHHRAQVSMALQQLGIEPPDFDYIFHHG